jgi:hypothetical protein
MRLFAPFGGESCSSARGANLSFRRSAPNPCPSGPADSQIYCPGQFTLKGVFCAEEATREGRPKMKVVDFFSALALAPMKGQEMEVLILEAEGLRVTGKAKSFGGEDPHWGLLLVSEAIPEAVFSTRKILPHNQAVIQRSRRARDLGLTPPEIEPEWETPELGFTECEFREAVNRLRSKAVWGTKNHGPQIVGGSDEHPEYGDEDYFGPGWVFPALEPGITKNHLGYFQAVSPDGATLLTAWIGASSCSDSGWGKDEELLERMTEEQRELFSRLKERAIAFSKERQFRTEAEEKARDETLRANLAREFGLS